MDRLESHLIHKFVVVRLDIGSRVGATVRDRYRTGVVPTFIVFDEDGREVWRLSGSVPRLNTILSLDV